ncbi:MAG: hypothetical protein U0R19_40810 [Bryobacteraceae bacterium]
METQKCCGCCSTPPPEPDNTIAEEQAAQEQAHQKELRDLRRKAILSGLLGAFAML